MAHEIAKLLLEHAETFVEREEAVRSALNMGMPLNEIEAYLDWVAQVKVQRPAPTAEPLASASSQKAEATDAATDLARAGLVPTSTRPASGELVFFGQPARETAEEQPAASETAKSTVGVSAERRTRA